MLRKNTTRVMVVVSGLVVGLVNFGILVCVRALTSSDMSGVWMDLAYAVGGAVGLRRTLRRLAPIWNGVYLLRRPSSSTFPTRISRFCAD